MKYGIIGYLLQLLDFGVLLELLAVEVLAILHHAAANTQLNKT